MSNMYFLPFRPTYDGAGLTVPGSQHYFTVSDGGTGGEVPSAPFADAAKTIHLSNPVVADGIGKLPPVYLDEAVQYRVRIYGRTAIAGVDTPLEEYAPYIPGAGDGTESGLRADLAESSGAAQVGKSGGGTVQDALATVSDQDFSAAPSSGQSALAMEKTFAGEVGDDSDYRGILLTCNFVGAHGAFQMNNLHLQNEVRHTSGTISFAQAAEGYVRLGLQGSTTGDIAAAHVFKGHIANESLASNIAGAIVFQASDTDYGDDIAGAAGTMDTVIGFSTGDLSHATKLTTQAFGFFAGNMTTPGAGVIVAAFGTEMAGAGKWGLYFSGNSPSAHLGNLSIGQTTVPAEALDVRGNVAVTGVITAAAGTVAQLQATPSIGARSFVTDATATTFGTAVAGGGSNKVPVYYDGAGWKIG